MLRPESPLADHRSLLPRRLLPVKAQIAPADKRRNRRSLELAAPVEPVHNDYPKLLISRTTDSLNTDCPRRIISKQDSNDSLKRALLPKQEKRVAAKEESSEPSKRTSLCKQDSTESSKRTSTSKNDLNDSSKIISDDKGAAVKQESNESKRSPILKHSTIANDVRRVLVCKQDSHDLKRVSSVNKCSLNTLEPVHSDSNSRNGARDASDRKGLLNAIEKCEEFSLPNDLDEQWSCRRVLERRGRGVPPTLPPVAEKATKVARWGSGLLSPREEPNIRPARSWYGYGTLPTDGDKSSGVVGAAAGGRRALELLLSGGGLKSLARQQRPVRRAASRDSVLSTKHNESSDGLRKCSTVLALTERDGERVVPHNRLRAPSICSRCSSVLSLAGAAGSRYSLDAAGSGFVPAANINCRLCLEDASPDQVSIVSGCGCIYCTKCMKSYVQFEVCNGAYEISCPDARCKVGAALTLTEISTLVEFSLMEKHLRFRLNHDVAMDAGRAFCPRVGCDTIVSVRAASPAHCPTCRHDFCIQCNQEWHGELSCEAAAAAAASSSSSAGAGAPLLLDSELIKLCPMCRVPIEKDEGCAQMMCKRCKHVFCWYCLASLDDDFLLRHYDKGPCKNKLGHSRASVVWHRAQVVGIFAGFGLLLLVASPLLLLAAPCIVCCKCRLCNPSTKNLEEVEEGESMGLGREDDNNEDITRVKELAD